MFNYLYNSAVTIATNIIQRVVNYLDPRNTLALKDGNRTPKKKRHRRKKKTDQPELETTQGKENHDKNSDDEDVFESLPKKSNQNSLGLLLKIDGQASLRNAPMHSDVPRKKHSEQVNIQTSLAAGLDARYVLDGDLHPSFVWLSSIIKKCTGKDLILVGGALASLYLREGKEAINDYDCLLIGKTLDELQALLKEAGIQSAIEGKSGHPILKILLEDNGKRLEVEISTSENSSKNDDEAIKDYVKGADLSVAAMSMRLDAPPYIIDGEEAMRDLDNQIIHLNNRDKNCFREDPSRLFRLAKWQLKYPDFSLGRDVIDAKDALASEFFANLLCPRAIEQISTARLNAARFSTALTKMLERFELTEVISALAKLNILQALTGFDRDTIDSLLPICEEFNLSITSQSYKSAAEQKKERLFFVFFSHYLVANGKKDEDLRHWPFFQVARSIDPASRGYYNYLQHRLCQSPVDGLYFLDGLDRAADRVRDAEKQTSLSSPIQFTKEPPAVAGI